MKNTLRDYIFFGFMWLTLFVFLFGWIFLIWGGDSRIGATLLISSISIWGAGMFVGLI